jgi:hypothetical protein
LVKGGNNLPSWKTIYYIAQDVFFVKPCVVPISKLFQNQQVPVSVKDGKKNRGGE